MSYQPRMDRGGEGRGERQFDRRGGVLVRTAFLWCSRSLALAALVLAAALFPTACNTQTQHSVLNWEIAGPYPVDRVDREAYPSFYAVFLTPWQRVSSDPEGLVDLNLHLPRENPSGDLVLARTVFWSDQDVVLEVDLGYSGELDVFLNGAGVRSAGRPCTPPDPGGTVSVGCTDRLPLHAKRGLNEMLLMVSSESDSWAFRATTALPLVGKAEAHGQTEALWATPDTFLTPESVLKDPTRDILYVTSFDNEFSRKAEPSGYISKLSLDGEVLEHRWVSGLSAPTGMDIWHDTLFVAEREHMLAIDLASGAVAGRWAIPDPDFPNDLVIDDEGVVYISDTRSGDWEDSRVYRFRDGQFDVFANEGISRANGLWIHDGWLIVGSSGDGLLKRVELSTGRLETIISLGAGIIDGIRVDREGNYLVSHWEGRLYRISPAGEILELLDARPEGWNTADFEFLPDSNLILFPTFLDNRVRAVRIGG